MVEATFIHPDASIQVPDLGTDHSRAEGAGQAKVAMLEFMSRSGPAS